MGLDWDKIRADYEARATPEELGKVLPVPKQPRAKRKSASRPKSPKPVRPEGIRYWRVGRTISWDVDEAMGWWLDGMTVTDIANKLNKDPDTIRNMFHKDERYDSRRDLGGSKPKEVCKRGHKYDEVGFTIGTRGGKDCNACRRERGAANYRKKKERERELQQEALGRSEGPTVHED